MRLYLLDGDSNSISLLDPPTAFYEAARSQHVVSLNQYDQVVASSWSRSSGLEVVLFNRDGSVRVEHLKKKNEKHKKKPKKKTKRRS
jgi:hypothetical protein